MADNYLEYRQEEIAQGRMKIVRKGGPSLDTLLHRNRSYRGYDPSRAVTEAELEDLVRVTALTASGMNRQPLRFRLVTEAEAGKVLPHITLGASLPEEHLPKPGTEPKAFLVVCSAVPEDRVVDIDLGFAGQSILLRATEMGLGASSSSISGRRRWRRPSGFRWSPSPSSPSASPPNPSSSGPFPVKAPTSATTGRTGCTSSRN